MTRSGCDSMPTDLFPETHVQIHLGLITRAGIPCPTASVAFLKCLNELPADCTELERVSPTSFSEYYGRGGNT